MTSVRHIFILSLLLALICVPQVTHALSFSATLFSIVGVFLSTAGGILDIGMQEFTLKMGVLMGPGSPLGAMLTTSWTIVRDLVNLTFIFGLLYIGVTTILGNAGGNSKKMIASIIIGALLVNFSMFFAKVIIDVANTATVEIYKLMELKRRSGEPVGISDALMHHSGLLHLSKTGSFQYGLPADFLAKANGEDYIAGVVGGSVFILAATFVFAAGGILLIIRFVVLFVLLIFSPVGFVSKDLPLVGSWREKWWHAFISNALFAPAYFFMLYLTFMAARTFTGKTSGFSKLFDPVGRTSGIEAVGYFLVLIVLLVSSILIAKQIGAVGASKAVDMGNKMQKKTRAALWNGTRKGAGALVFGAPAAALRNTVGSRALKLKDNKELQRAATARGLKGFAARRALYAASAVSTSSFDARKVGGIGKKLGIGEGGGKGGYAKRVDEIAKKEEAFAKEFGADENVFREMGPAIQSARLLERSSIERRNALMEQLANETNPERRAELAREIAQAQSNIAAAEKVEGYKEAKQAAESRLKEQYAASLENRSRNMGQPARALYKLFIRTDSENKKAADKIRKGLKKTDYDKLLENITSTVKENSGGGGGAH